MCINCIIVKWEQCCCRDSVVVEWYAFLVAATHSRCCTRKQCLLIYSPRLTPLLFLQITFGLIAACCYNGGRYAILFWALFFWLRFLFLMYLFFTFLLFIYLFSVLAFYIFCFVARFSLLRLLACIYCHLLAD